MEKNMENILKNVFAYGENCWINEKDCNKNSEAKSKGRDYSNTYVVFDEPYQNLKKLMNGQKLIYELKTSNIVYSLEKVIANDNAVIVFFTDGTKKVMRCAKGEQYDIETAVAYAVAQKVYSSQSAFKKKIARVLVDCRTAPTKEEPKVESSSSVVVPQPSSSTTPTPTTVAKPHKDGEKRGRKPCKSCTTSCYGLQGLILPIKSKDKKRTVIVMHNGHLYSLKYGQYSLVHDSKKGGKR